MRNHLLTLAAIVALISPLARAGQQALDPTAALLQTRDRLLADLARLPRYTCVQSITRKYFGAPVHLRLPGCSDLIAAHDARSHELSLRSWDRLRLEVAIIENTYAFSWVGAPQFDKGNLERMSGGGPMGTGDFGTFLLEIFRRAIMTFQGEEVLNGRRLLKYSYDMPIDRSGYNVKMGEGWVLTAYSGTFLLDPSTTDITNLTVRTAELPQGGTGCLAVSEVDYGRTLIHDRLILIPRETRLRSIRRDGSETLNLTTYSGCREYASKSRMLLEAPPDSALTGAGPQPAPSTLLAEGLHLDTRIVTPIDSDTAWAGDPIEAVLRSPLHDNQHNIKAPAGTRLHGRLVRVGHESDPFDHFQIGVQLESVEINGQTVPLRAARYYRPNVMPGTRVSRLGPLTRDDPAAGIGTFIFRTDHLRLKQLDAEWVTIAPGEGATGEKNP
ncbi:MAG TPA: hypothetical protein VKE93_20225 [Candidatus Angelobacter sp.]|nr:hypothetical protein [Candidatus Angelobacter sp.]